MFFVVVLFSNINTLKGCTAHGVNLEVDNTKESPQRKTQSFTFRACLYLWSPSKVQDTLRYAVNFPEFDLSFKVLLLSNWTSVMMLILNAGTIIFILS